MTTKEHIAHIYQRIASIEKRVHSEHPHDGTPRDANSANTETGDTDPHIAFSERATNDAVDPRITYKPTTYQKCTDGLRKIKPWIDAVGLIVLIVYTGYTGCSVSLIKDSNQINRDALTSVQRAFVVFEQFQMSVLENKTKQVVTYTFRPALQNAGATPTRRALHYANWRAIAINTPIDTSFDFSDSKHLSDPAPFLIGPKITMTGAAMDLSAAHIEAVKAKLFRLYFWGWTTYDDIFGAHHITMMCTELTNIEEQANHVYAVAWQSCVKHNCADEECEGERYAENKVWHSAK